MIMNTELLLLFALINKQNWLICIMNKFNVLSKLTVTILMWTYQAWTMIQQSETKQKKLTKCIFGRDSVILFKILVKS